MDRDEDFVWKRLEEQTGMTSDDLPDCFPIEEYYNSDTDEFDFDGMQAW